MRFYTLVIIYLSLISAVLRCVIPTHILEENGPPKFS